jgi:hypothetical protein
LDVGYERISGSLGSLLLLWAAIERSAREEVVRVHGQFPRSAHGIAAVLKCWETTVKDAQDPATLGPRLAEALRARLQAPLAIRNGLCHGLTGLSSGSSETPAKLEWEINGEAHSLGWEELQAWFSLLSKVPRAISIISAPPRGHIADRRIYTPQNREWWLSEFGLELPQA